ncbi:MAG: arabinofuranosidase catalytic domain-containing protein [Protaetiibacter sp.]
MSISAVVAALLAFSALMSGAPAAQAAGSGPCDIADTAGTPCVAAYSSVRALYQAYNGPLYEVTRQSDGTSTNVVTLAAGGYANASAQDAFCAGTVCLVTKIYDQSPQDNDLTVAPVGLAGSENFGVRADALPVVVDGHEVYGLLFDAGTGYRKLVGNGIPTGAQPESIYAVLSGTYITQVDRCCFGFGNAETVADNTGSAHMDALNISTVCTAAPCNGVGPWWQADLENGTFMSGGGSNPSNVGMGWDKPFVTGVLRNDGTSSFALDGGDATASSLTSLYSGALPSGYSPMLKEGGIILGIGGDNSNAASGAFFEGAMLSGYASNTTVADIQTNIDAADYTGTTGGGTGVPIAYPNGGQCIDVSGDDVGGNGTPVQIWDCVHDAVDQRWTTTNGLVTGPLKSLNRCMDVTGAGTASGTPVQLYDCNGNAAQVWTQQADGTLLNPNSGKCLTSPGGSTVNGTQLVIDTCTGSASQRFWVAYPHRPINAPAGKCVDVAGANDGTTGSDVTISDCTREEVDQYWRHNADQTLTSLGLCLDIDGNGTAVGTDVQLWTCSSVGGQKWVQQDDGTLLNPQSGLCLTAPATTNGTVLEIQRCTGAADQKFAITGGQAYNSGGHPVNAPGGKCVDAVGDDQYGNWFGVNVQLWDCLTGAADQHWIYKSDDRTLRSLTRCLDIKGNATAAGTDVHLFNCNGVGGQEWVPQPDGTLKNPQSGLCLTATGGATSNGTILEIQACTGAASQKFTVTSQVALSPGTRVSLQATTSCCTSSYVRHAYGNGLSSTITQSSSAGDKADATWIVRAGLSNSACVSFESSNYANGYLRQVGSVLTQQANDGTPGFATDATFCPVPGQSGTGISLQWAGNSSLYLRHYGGTLYLASNGGSNAWDTTTSWAQDVSWLPVSPWVS